MKENARNAGKRRGRRFAVSGCEMERWKKFRSGGSKRQKPRFSRRSGTEQDSSHSTGEQNSVWHEESTDQQQEKNLMMDWFRHRQ